MNIRFLYGSSISVLPLPASDVLARATAADLRVLLYLGARLRTPADALPTPDEMAKALSITPSEVTASLAFWRGTGILEAADEPASEGAAAVPPERPTARPSPRSRDDVAAETEESITGAASVPTAAETTPKPASLGKTVDATVNATVEKPRVTVRRPSRRNELPNYTAEEMAHLLESTPDTAEYIHACEQIWGKLFNTHETNILLGLSDYLGLEWEYVVTLLAHCVDTFRKKGMKGSLRYVEQIAFSYYDEGVSDLPALQERIRRSEMETETEGKLRTLFGMGSRALTPTEKKCFSAWLYEYHYDMTIIRKAYDITVDTKGEASIKYMNSILANWNSEDLRTVEAIDASMAEFRDKRDRRTVKSTAGRSGKLPEPMPGGSFETDDFFDSAVSKTFGDDSD